MPGPGRHHGGPGGPRWHRGGPGGPGFDGGHHRPGTAAAVVACSL